MKKVVITSTLTILYLLLTVELCLAYYPYSNYRYGDCNGDGWCNGGDFQSLCSYVYMSHGIICTPAGDINGDGYYDPIDVAYLWNWLTDEIISPANECSWEVPDLQYGGFLIIDSCFGNPGDTVYIGCNVEVTSTCAFHFSLAYDNEDIDDIFIQSYNSIFDDSTWNVWSITRANMPPGNNDTLNTISIGLANFSIPYIKYISFADTASICTLGVVISSSSSGGYHPIPFESDPHWGPPMYYSDYGYEWYGFNIPSSEDIPTLSEWGMLIMGLLLLAAGTVAVVRRKRDIVKA